MAKQKPLPQVDGQGIVDMHVHVGPEFIRRRYSPARLAEEARREGIGVVMKNHFQPTTAWVSQVRKPDDRVPLVGAVVLNLGCGGIGPHGIRSAMSGWKDDTTQAGPNPDRFVVWMPTVCAEAHLACYGRRDMDTLWGVEEQYTAVIEEGMGLRIIDDAGAVIPGLDDALAMIAKYDLVLASGHLSGPETKLLARRAHEAGVNRIVLTHPLWKATELTPDEVRDLHRDYGAYSEICFTNLAMHGIDDHEIGEFIEVVRAVGPKGVILSSDCGQMFTPTVADSMRAFFALLHENGVSEDDITQMSVVNPRTLLFAERAALAKTARAAE